MAARQPLRGLPASSAGPSPRAIFCGHCGKPPSDGVMPEVGSRVCRRCNLGLLLDAPVATLPKPNEAFVVVDSSLSICGLSRRAERLLGITEVDAVDRRLTELLVPADAESRSTARAQRAVDRRDRRRRGARHRRAAARR